MNSRLISLDFFRGLTIAAMIVVNDPGSWSYVYPPLSGIDPQLISLVWALFYTFFIYLIVKQMYKRKVFIKI